MDALPYVVGLLIGLVVRALWKAGGSAPEAAATTAAGSVATLEAVQRQLGDVSARLEQLALRQANMQLEVLDTAERVAHKLQDRERKRKHAEQVAFGDIPQDDWDPDEGRAMARARQQYPLFPTSEDEQ